MKKNFSEDSYFFNVNDAITEARKDNSVFLGHPTIFGKQICYYNANSKREDVPDNCVFVPLENFYNYFYTTKYRLPTKIVVYNDDFEEGESKILSNSLASILRMAVNDRNNLIQLYLKQNKELKANFNDNKLRIFIPTSKCTTVMQYVSKAIYEVLKQNDNYEVKLFIQETEFESCNDPLPLVVEYNNFKPHIVININHILPFCNEEVFNFIWFQDEMPFLQNYKKYNRSKREYFFSLTNFHDKILEKKGIPFLRQNFAINQNIFKKNKTIKRENKIVFIGSSYGFNLINPQNLDGKMLGEIVNHLEKGLVFDDIFISEIAKKYDVSNVLLSGKIIPYVVRDFSVIWLCESELSKKFEIEIYGWGWDEYPQTKAYYKGELSYGQALVDVYSSAKYTLAPHADYIIQQRVLEAISCGCQPILYDCREKDNPPYYEDVLIYYKSKDELINSFSKINDKKFEEFIKKFTYKSFTDKILNIIEKEKNVG